MLKQVFLFLFYDILVYSKTWKEHLQHLEQILIVLEKNQFYPNISKDTFGKQEFQYLIHVISKEGLKVDPNKIKKIKEWP